MRTLTGMIVIGGLLTLTSLTMAQDQDRGPATATKATDADDLVARMMEFDKDKDAKLTRAEVTDQRLHRLFDRADVDKDGVVTKEELLALATREALNLRDEPPGGGPPGFRMRPPRPGEVLPPMLQGLLNFTPEQKQQLDDLQKMVDAGLEQILNDEQREQLKQMRQRGPVRFGPPGRERPPAPGDRAP